jgi:predicted secreted protein
MGDTKGYEGKAAASSDGVTYYEIGGLTDASLPMSRNTIDTTDFDSGEDEEHLAARRSGSFSATAHWDEDDQGLMVVHDAFHAGTTCYIRWRPRGNTVGYKEYLLSGTVTSFEESSSQDAAAEVSFEVAKSGALTEQAQS